MARRIPFACSFCGKPRSEALRVIAGPNGVYICEECVALCREILAELPAPPTPGRESPRRLPGRASEETTL